MKSMEFITNDFIEMKKSIEICTKKNIDCRIENIIKESNMTVRFILL